MMSAPALSPALQAALRYAQRGWAVIPLHRPVAHGCSCGRPTCVTSAGKHPRIEEWQNEASTDPITIRRWFEQWPDSNLGIATGVRSGIIVIDVDRDSGGHDSLAALERRYSALPSTLESLTGSEGRHLLFRYPAGLKVRNEQSGKKLGPGLDVRGDGGQIVAPPSLHRNSRQYAWRDADATVYAAPDWLIELIKDKPRPTSPPPPPRPRNGPSNVLERARRYLSRMPGAISGSGGHNALWNAAIVCRGFDLSSEEAFSLLDSEYNQRCEPAWSEKELRHKIQDAENADVPRGYLLDASRPEPIPRQKVATVKGPPPGIGDGHTLGEAADAREQYGPGADDDLPIGDGSAAVKPHPIAQAIRDGWRPFTAAELLTDLPPPVYVWRPRIPLGKVVLLNATGGSYKSTLLLDLACRRACGFKALDGTELAPGETVIFTAEDNREDYQRKLEALRLEWGPDFDAEKIAARVHIIDVTGILDMKLVRAEGYNAYVITEVPEILCAVVKERASRADLIIIETMNRVGAGESNDPLSALITACERIVRLSGAAVMPVGHVSQAVARAGVTDQHAARGGTAQTDNARGALAMSKLTKDNVATDFPQYADIPEDQLERYLVLAHPKGWTNGPRAEPVFFERSFNEKGPVLRLANMDARPKATSGDRIEAVRALVERLDARAVLVTKTLLRDYKADLGVAKNGVGKLVTEAFAAQVIYETDEIVRGGGRRIKARARQVRPDPRVPEN